MIYRRFATEYTEISEEEKEEPKTAKSFYIDQFSFFSQ
jgi:hypothetical protein